MIILAFLTNITGRSQVAHCLFHAMLTGLFYGLCQKLIKKVEFQFFSCYYYNHKFLFGPWITVYTYSTLIRVYSIRCSKIRNSWLLLLRDCIGPISAIYIFYFIGSIYVALSKKVKNPNIKTNNPRSKTKSKNTNAAAEIFMLCLWMCYFLCLCLYVIHTLSLIKKELQIIEHE